LVLEPSAGINMVIEDRGSKWRRVGVPAGVTSQTCQNAGHIAAFVQ
jgi:hypothetical protein